MAKEKERGRRLRISSYPAYVRARWCARVSISGPHIEAPPTFTNTRAHLSRIYTQPRAASRTLLLFVLIVEGRQTRIHPHPPQISLSFAFSFINNNLNLRHAGTSTVAGKRIHTYIDSSPRLLYARIALHALIVVYSAQRAGIHVCCDFSKESLSRRKIPRA